MIRLTSPLDRSLVNNPPRPGVSSLTWPPTTLSEVPTPSSPPLMVPAPLRCTTPSTDSSSTRPKLGDTGGGARATADEPDDASTVASERPSGSSDPPRDASAAPDGLMVTAASGAGWSSFLRFDVPTACVVGAGMASEEPLIEKPFEGSRAAGVPVPTEAAAVIAVALPALVNAAHAR